MRVDLYDADTDDLIGSQLTDGTGWFGFVDLAPGRYKAIVDGEEVYGRRVITFSVAAGDVAEVQITPKRR